jgi:hypothetical protein
MINQMNIILIFWGDILKGRMWQMRHSKQENSQARVKYKGGFRINFHTFFSPKNRLTFVIC